MRRLSSVQKAALVAATVSAIASATGGARAEVIEKVIAVVNDEAIFLSDLRHRSAPFLGRVAQLPNEAQRSAALNQLEHQLLEQMINDELIKQAGERMEVTVTRTDIDRAIRNVQKNTKLDDAQFWEAVRGQGFTPDQYREDLRRQLFRLKVLNERVRNRVNITEEEVRRRYDESVRRGRRESEFHPEHIFLPIPEGAGAAELARVMREAQRVRDSIDTQDDFEQQMAEIGGGDLGWLHQGDLSQELEDALMGMEEHEIGQPVRGPTGVYIFLLLQRQQTSATIPPYEQSRMRIYQDMMEEAMQRQEQLFLQELRRQAVIDIRL